MRVLMLLLLMAPAPLWSQAADADPEPGDAAVQEQQEPRLVEGWERSTATSIEQAVPLRAEAERSASAAAAQPTMRGFLYQVFLTAVTALVTALIWKAVF